MKKRSKIIYWISTIWLVLGMMVTGAGQLLKIKTGQGGVEMVDYLGYPLYFLSILGFWKISGSFAILIPKFPLLKEWVYAGFFFILTGAIFSHLASGDSVKTILPALLLLFLAIISWYFRPLERKIISLKSKQ